MGQEPRAINVKETYEMRVWTGGCVRMEQSKPTSFGSMTRETFLFPWTVITHHHKPCGLKQKKCIISQFWRLKVQDEDVSRAVLPPKILGRDLSSPQLLMAKATLGVLCYVNAHSVLPPFSHGLLLRVSPLCLCAHVSLSSPL